MLNPYYRIYYQKLKNKLWHYPKSLFFNYYYGYPSKKLILIGVTGTDGKTTTTNLIHQSLLNAGVKAGIISTVGAKIGDQEVKLGLHTTSPDSSVVQKVLLQMVNEGLTHAVIEVTAHALDQYRYGGCHFHITALTNTSHEHLDDFLNLQHYIDTKAKLLVNSDIAIINHDDESYPSILPKLKHTVKTFGINLKSFYQAKNVILSPDLLSFNVGKLIFKTDSTFHYQIYNILIAHAVLDQLKLPSDIILSTILNFPEIKGRREEVKNDYKIHCLIDFAHTPAALKTTLQSLRLHTKGKLIVIFGATGGRDQSKRPLMGRVVSEIADIAIITADDTRNEKVEDINKQIISGLDQKRLDSDKFIYYDIPNRQDAFNLAVKLSSTGDTIIACGKGHETTILHGKTEYPWSESEAFRTAFRQKTE